MIRAYVRHTATGKTIVPNSLQLCLSAFAVRSIDTGRTHSRSTIKDIEQQNTPHKFGTCSNSIRLWMDEQIHRRRCERSTEKVSGTSVLHLAALQNIIFRLGKFRIMSVLKNRSSPASLTKFSA